MSAGRSFDVYFIGIVAISGEYEALGYEEKCLSCELK